MKKIFPLIFFTAVLLPLSAQTLSISNTFGGNTETLEGQDLLIKNQFSLSDRLQTDFRSSYLDFRGRCDIYNINFDNTSPEFLFRGYIRAGSPYISGVAGNSFFSKFAIKAAEIDALDTVPNYGKVIKNGLGIYSEIPFNKKNTLKLGAAVESDCIFGEDDFALDLGADYVLKNRFSAGVSLRDVTAGKFGKYSAFTGFNFGNFRFNTGYIYNNTDTDLLPAESKHSVQAAFSYANKKLKIKAGSTVISALTPEYLRGGKEKTETYENGAIPFMATASFTYSFKKPEIDLGLQLKYSDMLKNNNSRHIIIYPYADYVFCNKLLELNGGLKFDCTNSGGKNTVIFSLPVSIKVTGQTKF